MLLGARQRLSHTTALLVWGVPLPRREQDDAPVHVTSTDGAPVMRRAGVVGHRGTRRPRDESVHDGVRLSVPTIAWFESRTVLSLRELVIAGDHLLGPAGLVTTDDLAAAVSDGSRAVVRARSALALIRVGSESAMETGLRLDVVDAGFPEPELNVDVTDGDGRFLGRVDLAWPDLRIGLEYDGDHHRDRDTFQHDQRRGNGFAVNGWIIVHATAIDARRPAVLFERLRQAFASRRADVVRGTRRRGAESA